MRKGGFSLFNKIIAFAILFGTSVVFGQSPNLTLTTSLGAEHITCASTPFTLTVSDSTLG